MRQVRCQFNCKLEGSRTQIGFGNVPDFWCERPTVSGMTNIYSVLGRAHPARYSKARSPESMNRNANFKISQYATTTGEGVMALGWGGEWLWRSQQSVPLAILIYPPSIRRSSRSKGELRCSDLVNACDVHLYVLSKYTCPVVGVIIKLDGSCQLTVTGQDSTIAPFQGHQ